MRPDDVALDFPCETCKARVGEPCTMIVSPRQGLMERAVPHQSRRAAAVAASDSPVGRVVPPADSVDTAGESDAGAGRTRPFGDPTGTPLSTGTDGTVPPDASASLGQLPLVELECGHPASAQQAYRALQQPQSDLFCFICAKNVERAS